MRNRQMIEDYNNLMLSLRLWNNVITEHMSRRQMNYLMYSALEVIPKTSAKGNRWGFSRREINRVESFRLRYHI